MFYPIQNEAFTDKSHTNVKKKRLKCSASQKIILMRDQILMNVTIQNEETEAVLKMHKKMSFEICNMSKHEFDG